MRCFFNLQECGTDEVASTWLSGDNVTGLTYLSWDANDPWVSDMYYRIYYNIALCNEFLRNATDEKIAQFTDQEQTEIRIYRAEARFMRALFYYHALDLFRNIPFVTENDPLVGVSLSSSQAVKMLPQSSAEAIIIYFRIIVILLNLIIMLLNLECYSVISVIVNSILLRSNVMRYLPSLAGFMLSPFWSLR